MSCQDALLTICLVRKAEAKLNLHGQRKKETQDDQPEVTTMLLVTAGNHQAGGFLRCLALTLFPHAHAVQAVRLFACVVADWSVFSWTTLSVE